ncbi:hypothetical protein [Caryophanon tenue]|nr:hypothetical protein [Caryophanon tenue]
MGYLLVLLFLLQALLILDDFDITIRISIGGFLCMIGCLIYFTTIIQRKK